MASWAVFFCYFASFLPHIFRLLPLEFENNMLRRYLPIFFCIFLQENTACDTKYYAEAVKERIFSWILLKNYRLDFKKHFQAVFLFLLC